jgi:hypothetical protein
LIKESDSAMDRPKRGSLERLRPVFRSRKLYAVLAGAGLLGTLWGVDGSAAQAAQPKPRPATRLLATPVQFDDLIRLLDDPRPAIRLEAIHCLATLNRQSADTILALRRRFEDPNPLVRVHAVRVAIRAGMPVQDGVPVAAQLLIPELPDVCCLAAQILGGAGPAATEDLPQLHACLTASSIWVRLHAARAALQIDATDTAALDTLRSAQESEHGDAREFAANAVEDVVHGLARQLRNVDPAVRLAAVARLEQLGTAAASAKGALTARLADDNLLVRAHAARAALRAGVPAREIVGVASELLVPRHLDALRVAASILVEIGPDAADSLPRLHVCLKAKSIAVRLYAAEAALRIDPSDVLAIDVLQDALDQQQADIRFFSVNALGTAVKNSDEAVFSLHRALSDPDPKVATAAALHLSRTHDLARHVVPDNEAGNQIAPGEISERIPLDVAQQIDELSHTLADVRQAAAIRLAAIGPAARHAIPALTHCLDDSESVVRLHCAQAIWEIDRNGYQILPVLVDLMLTNHGNTQIGAAYTLGRMGPAASDTLPWLAKFVNDSKTIDRLVFAEAIVQIDPARQASLNVLVSGMNAAEADVRYLSAVALGASPLSRQAVVEQTLRVAAADRNFHVRCAACETLCQLQERTAAVQAAQSEPAGDVVPVEATETPSQ